MTVEIVTEGERWAPTFLVVHDGRVVGRHLNWAPAAKQKRQIEAAV